MTGVERITRGVTPEEIYRRKQAGRPVTLTRWIAPITSVAREKGSVGVALLPGADEEKFIEAMTIAAGGRKNIRKVHADTKTNASLSVRTLQTFAFSTGDKGFILAEGLDVLGERPDGEGAVDMREYLAGLALWRRKNPTLPNKRPPVVAYGAVALQDAGRLDGGVVAAFTMNEGLTYSVDAHFSIDTDDNIKPFYLRVFDRTIMNTLQQGVKLPANTHNAADVTASGVESAPLGI